MKLQQHNDLGGNVVLLGARLTTDHPQWRPISFGDGNNLSFCQGNMNYAATVPLVPISMAELPEAAAEMPLAFARHNGVLELVALCGLEPGISLAVGSNGYWQFPYVPTIVAVHPFALAVPSRPDQPVLDRLWADQHSTWLVEKGKLPIFQQDGTPASVLSVKLQMLQHKLPDSKRDGPAINALAENALLMPWLGLEALGVQRIDPHALANLAPPALARLHELGGLWIAHAHLLSLAKLPRLMEFKRQADQEASSRVSLDQLLASYQDGTLHFS